MPSPCTKPSPQPNYLVLTWGGGESTMYKQEQQKSQGRNTDQNKPASILLLPGSRYTLLALPELAQQSG